MYDKVFLATPSTWNWPLNSLSLLEGHDSVQTSWILQSQYPSVFSCRLSTPRLLRDSMDILDDENLRQPKGDDTFGSPCLNTFLWYHTLGVFSQRHSVPVLYQTYADLFFPDVFPFQFVLWLCPFYPFDSPLCLLRLVLIGTSVPELLWGRHRVITPKVLSSNPHRLLLYSVKQGKVLSSQPKHKRYRKV